MSWRDNLRQASFRGVVFHVDDRKLATGRRLHVHEFPKRNSPFPEDMGKKTRKYEVDAYVLGDDYMARRDRLVAACEREGAGQLVDHWGRSQRVKCEVCDLTETKQDGRYAKFKLSFVEDGAAMPMGVAATAVQLAGAAIGLQAAAVTAFAAGALVGQVTAGLSVALAVPPGGIGAGLEVGIGVPGVGDIGVLP